MKMFALVDCNSFYCSCEKLFRPDLADKPVVVLSNNDGCIVSRSSEAKSLGVEMGAPFYKWKKFCEQNSVTWFSSNYALYGDLSSRVMSVLQQFCPNIEQYSIDEAFLDLNGVRGADQPQWCEDLAKTVRRWTGIPVSIGISHSKTLAKIANHYAKAHGFYGYTLAGQKQIDEILQKFSPSEVWGVGRRSIMKLNRYGIWSALDLKNADPFLIRKKFSIVLERTVRELNGQACIEFDPQKVKRKGIQVSRSFGELIENYDELEKAVTAFATRAAEKLRQQDSIANGLYVYLRTNPHRTEPQDNSGAATEFIVPTANTFELVESALKILRQIYRKGYLYQKAGVMLLDIVDSTQHEQEDLWGITKNICKQNTLMSTLDKINNTYGRSMIRLASEGFESRGWQLRCDYRSARYTTKWGELPAVT